MRLTINQLRRIIKEEISRSTTHSRRTLREMAEANYSLEINNVTDRAAEVSAIDARYSARSPEYRMVTPPTRAGHLAFIDKINRVVSEQGLSTIEFGGPNATSAGFDADGYSEASDSLLLFGSEDDLVKLAQRIDPDLIDKIEEVQKF